jgi:hypothetical protein
MKVLGDIPKNEIRGILGARFIFAIPNQGADWKIGVLKDNDWFSIDYEQLKTLNFSGASFYNDTPIPPHEEAQFYIAVPKPDQQWSAAAGIYRGQKWMPITEEEMKDLAERFQDMSTPSNMQNGL